MKQDIDTALKMLRARGGELDKKAADIIVDLFAEVVGKRVGVKLDERAKEADVTHLLGVVAELRRDLITRNSEFIEAKTKIAKLEVTNRLLNKVIEDLQRDQAGLIHNPKPVSAAGHAVIRRIETAIASAPVKVEQFNGPPKITIGEMFEQMDQRRREAVTEMSEARAQRVEQANVSHETLDYLHDGLKARHFDRLTGGPKND